MKIVLLVCEVDCSRLRALLACAGCSVIAVNDGAEAILRAKHESIDTAILISTGKEMDVAETALNLSDINSSLKIIIVTQGAISEQQLETEAIQHAIPQTRTLTIEDLRQYLNCQVERQNRR